MKYLHTCRAIFLAVILLLGATDLRGDEPTRAWSFDSDAAGTIATGFREHAGKWTIQRNGDSQVLAQTAESPKPDFNVAIVEDPLYTDLDLSVKLKSIAGVIDQGGGLVWRLQDERNYYIARYNPLETNLRLYHVVDGKRTQIQHSIVIANDDWHTLRISARGTSIRCFFDGTKVFETQDPTFRDAGKIGLWTKADAQTLFDNLTVSGTPAPEKSQAIPTREFEIRSDRAFLGDHGVDLWGLRCGNALFSDAVTERHVRNLDNMAAHGINLIGVYVQGTNAGWPNPDGAHNGFTRDGHLKPQFARRLEWLIREADQRGMVVMVGVLTPRKDQEFYNNAAIERAIRETAEFLSENGLRNVFVDLMHEFSHEDRIDHLILREPDGAIKKTKLTDWFKSAAPTIEAGICPSSDSATADTYPNLDVRIIQKKMPIPTEGFVVNVETLRQDVYENDGVFSSSGRDEIFADCRRYLEAPNAVMLFHAAFIQGITNASGTAPHAEMGGYGSSIRDRGVRFYYDWVRDNVGRWEFPQHVPANVNESRASVTK